MTTCVMCGSKRVKRRSVTVRFRDGRVSFPVRADVCQDCGERYYDLDAMQKLEQDRKHLGRKRRIG